MTLLILILNVVLAILVISGGVSGVTFAWVYLIEVCVIALVALISTLD